MTDEERLTTSIEQIFVYGDCQYTEWRIAAVRSIRKILLNLDDFYADLLPDLERNGEKRDLVHCQIRNGWLYEAVSQAEQAIEDLFSMMQNLNDKAYFAKNVIRYNAAKVKDYIWNFDVENLEYICQQMKLPFFPLDEPWEIEEVFEGYKNAILLTQRFIKELQGFHKKYYQDYCQYKHGLAVALTPMQNPLMKDDVKRRESIMSEPLVGGLQTFHQGTVAQYEKRNGTLPAMSLLVTPKMQHIREMHDEGNLLYFTIHVLDVDEVVKFTEHACILYNIIWRNIKKNCQEKLGEPFAVVSFPTERLSTVCEIGFPKDE